MVSQTTSTFSGTINPRQKGKRTNLRTGVMRKQSTQIFQKTNISYVRVCIKGQEMFVFQKNWRALFSCNARFEIRPFITDEITLGCKIQLLSS